CCYLPWKSRRCFRIGCDTATPERNGRWFPLRSPILVPENWQKFLNSSVTKGYGAPVVPVSRTAIGRLLRSARQRFDRRAGADKVAVARNVVDARYWGPKFCGKVLGTGRKCRFLPAVGMIPHLSRQFGGRVRRVDERVVVLRPFSARH